MLFTFIRYTQPGWQFNLNPQVSGRFASCNISTIDEFKDLIDLRYETESAKIADVGYRLWNRGVLLESTIEEMQQLNRLPKPSLNDEYIFIRKYWGSAWTGFSFLMRIITLKNLFKEWSAYFRTRNIKRINAYDKPAEYKDYETFQSSLIAMHPLVAVIIPTLNRYKYLKNVLSDLELQDYKNFEVIVIDQSDDFRKDFYTEFQLCLKVSNQKEKLLWTARNSAVNNTNADYLLFFDDDSRIQMNWITEHLKCIDYFNADISAGVSLAVKGQKIPVNYSFFRWADQFDSGNAMIKRKVMKQIGMFDEQFNGQRMGDAEFGFRAYINGLKSISNYKAARIHLKVDEGGLREMGSWDGFRSKKIFAPKPVPSVTYLFKKYFPKELNRNAIFIGIMLSNVPYKYKRSGKMLFLSALLTVVKSPILLAQYLSSKKIAQKMLQKNIEIKVLE